MKKVRFFLKWTIQAIIIVYIAVLVLLHIPTVQHTIGVTIAKAVSEKLGTRVEIEQVDLGFLNRIIINNINIYDQKNRKMLSTTRLATKIDIFSLVKNGSISISSAQVFDLHAVFSKSTSTSPANYQFVLDSLASKDKSKENPFDLSIHSLIIHKGFIKYDQLDAPKLTNRFDTKHLQIENLSGNILLHHITNDTINAEIKSLSLKEKSGFVLNNLRFKMRADKQLATLSDLDIITPNSKLLGVMAKMTYLFTDEKLNKTSIKGDINIKDANILASDFHSFLPILKKFDKPIRLSVSSQYKNQKLNISHLSLASSDKAFFINTRGTLNFNAHTPSIYLETKSAKINPSAFKLIDNLFNLHIPEQIVNMGDIYYQGNLNADTQNIVAKGNLRSDAGRAKIDFNLRNKNIQLTLNTSLINIGKITESPKFGNFSGNIKLTGATDLKQIHIDAKVPRFDYNHYSYKNILVKGSYISDCFEGIVGLNDPYGAFHFKGKIGNIRQFVSKKSKIEVDAKISVNRLNLAALQITNALGNRAMTFTSTLKGSASSLDDIDGLLHVSNASIAGEGKTLYIKDLNVKSHYGLLSKNLDIDTDFGEIHMSGLYNFSTIVKSFKNIIHNYLPSLANKGFAYTPTRKQNNFIFNAQINNYNLIKDYIKLPLKLNSPLGVSGQINENISSIQLFLMTQDAVYAGNEIKNLELTIAPDGNNLTTALKGEYNNSKKQHIYINSLADIGDNKISSSINYFAPGKMPLKGNINSDISFYNRGGDFATHIHFNPSNVSIDTVQLTLQPSNIEYHRKKLIINHFEISNNTQHITINGKTSGNPEDSLSIHLKDIYVPYILDLVNFHGVDFGGIASGTASVKSIFYHPVVNANLTVKDFTFQNGNMGELTAQATYASKEGVVYIDAQAFANENSYTDIKGFIDVKNQYINLPIYAHNTKLYFLKSFCQSFMDNIEGSTTGWCKVVGPLDQINLEGDFTANGTIHITPTGTTYTLKNSHIKMLPNEITFVNDTIYDAKGNIGIVTGGLHHNNLTNLSYNINIAAKNLLCYNFPQQVAKESFWGVVFATGTCNITGKSGETNLEIEVSPEPNTHIIYNAAQTASLEESSFIQWIDSKNDSVLTQNNQTDTINNKEKSLSSKDIVFHNTNTSSDIHINFLFNNNPNLTLEVIMDEAAHDNILLNGYGGIRATYYNKGNFQMYGNFLVDHGIYNLTIQNAIKKSFVFQPTSTIAFGGDPFNAALNLKGVYSLNSVPLSDLQLGESFSTNNTKVNCLLDIKGTPGAPTVSFGIDLPNLSNDAQQMIRSLLNSEEDLNQQAIYLLAVGRFYPQITNNAQQNSEEQNRTSLAMQSLLSGTLSQQINTVLSNVINSNNWNIGANIATGNEGFSNAEYEGVFSGSLLNNRLIFNGEVGYRDNVTTNTSSFIGDFDIRYLLFKNGNVALHFYNKTNDRYFTRNSLTTQGIGIILKKDFTNFRELFGRNKKKTKQKR